MENTRWYVELYKPDAIVSCKHQYFDGFQSFELFCKAIHKAFIVRAIVPKNATLDELAAFKKLGNISRLNPD